MSIENELLQIKENKELLTPVEVVSWAKRHPKSELYQQFTWDDEIAAHEYRVWQARRIIAIHITYEDGGRRFISLSIDRGKDGGGYRDLNQVRHAPDLREVMLEDALNELNRVKAKYEYLNELNKVWEAAEEVKTKRKRKKAA